MQLYYQSPFLFFNYLGVGAILPRQLHLFRQVLALEKALVNLDSQVAVDLLELASVLGDELDVVLRVVAGQTNLGDPLLLVGNLFSQQYNPELETAFLVHLLAQLLSKIQVASTF